MNNLIDNILTEWAYRVNDGMPDIKNPLHIFELKEVMTFIIYIDSFFLVNKIQMLYDHFLLFHYYNV